jgi:hypothetical protein
MSSEENETMQMRTLTIEVGKGRRRGGLFKFGHTALYRILIFPFNYSKNPILFSNGQY